VLNLITPAHVKGIDVIRIGTVTSEPALKFGAEALPLSDVKFAHEIWFSDFMDGEL
jgi:phosphoribosylformylglycinamidine synthase subunit PurL